MSEHKETGVPVRIYNPQFERTKDLHPGEEVVFGRGVRDAGELPNNSLVSHRHGVIAATESGFSVTSIGTYSGFVVRDTMTPSRLHIPRGIGPIGVPFANAIISFDHSVTGRLVVAVVGSELAEQWEESWGPEIEHDAAVARRSLGGRTQPPPGLKRKARGEPYTWFWTLVAMCEGGSPGGRRASRRTRSSPSMTVSAHGDRAARQGPRSASARPRRLLERPHGSRRHGGRVR